MVADMDEPGAADKSSIALAYHGIHGIIFHASED